MPLHPPSSHTRRILEIGSERTVIQNRSAVCRETNKQTKSVEYGDRVATMTGCQRNSKWGPVTPAPPDGRIDKHQQLANKQTLCRFRSVGVLPEIARNDRDAVTPTLTG